MSAILRRNPKEMHRLAKVLEALPKVSSVETNLHAGTLLVYHKEEASKDIRSGLKDMGVILMVAAAGVEMPTQSLADAVADLDARLSAATNGLLNLKLLVPFGLGAMALVQLLRRGLQIEGAPWYILAYFAFESYTRLNPSEETGKCPPEEPVPEK